MSQREKDDGEHVTVFKGRWYEGKEAQRSGRVRLILEEGHHTARGWYTYGDDETHFDVPLPMGRMRAGVYWFSRPEH